MTTFYLIVIFIVAYLLGSFPTGYLVVKKFTGQDIRKIGTGNVGAMNVSRATGKGGLFWLTVAADGGKGVLAILLSQWLGFLGYDLLWGVTLAGFGAVLGHCYPVFLRFRGGKAQASLIGILGILSWQCLLIPWGSIVIIYILASGYLFLGQFMGAIFLPIVAFFLAPKYFWLCLLMAVPILVRQWPRFIPMLKGQEPRWYWKKVDKTQKSE